MVAKVMGIDYVIDDLAGRLGELERAYLIDDYAEDKDSGIIDLVLVGNIDPYHLDDLSRKSERYIKRKIRSLVLNRDEYNEFEAKIKSSPHILIWEAKKNRRDLPYSLPQFLIYLINILIGYTYFII